MKLFSISFASPLLMLFLLISLPGQGQSPSFPLNPIPLQDMSQFQPVAGNWKLVGDARFDLNKQNRVKTNPGTGVLLNMPDKRNQSHLLTTMEHGDMELEMDFMMAKGSNSGVYLQGRYEVQLFDSWGESAPKFSDAGAIYQRWDEARGAGREGYEGHPPLQNVSKAPGLWQHYRIIFRAPRFNEQGQKVENAKFLEVYHNGVLVQKNIEVTGPTRAAAFADEQPTGPLMIQGDHGPVAIRNLKYLAYGTGQVSLADLELRAFEGKFNSVAEFQGKQPKTVMPVDVLEHLAPASRDLFAGQITGKIRVPVAAEYHVHLNLAWIPTDTNPNYINGAGEVQIANQPVLQVDGRTGDATGTVRLEAGEHPFTLSYFKSSAYWYAPSNNITLSVGAPGVAFTPIGSPLRAQDPVGAILVQVKQEPVMQRGFLNHHDTKKTHVLNVGEPGNINYAVSLDKGELLQIWRGSFLETTPMWHGRGETQLSLPLGSVQAFAAKPSFSFLTDQNTPWPDSSEAFTYLGYDVTPAGRPIVKYALGGASIRDALTPEEGGRKLTRTVTVRPGQETRDVYVRLAEGTDIVEISRGVFSINGAQYYLEVPKRVKPVVRTTAQNTQELVLLVKPSRGVGTVTYSYVL